jgi:Uma2 family endonuclease
MSTAALPETPSPPALRRRSLELLQNGDHFDQPTFHELYKQTDSGFRAELIGGVVYVASPLGMGHGTNHVEASYWLRTYSRRRPRLVCSDNTTVILAEDSEPQPDMFMAILLPTEDPDGYLVRAPELVLEIAYSTRAYDLYEKKRDYERHGVKEYIVAVPKQQRVFWFARNAAGEFEELLADNHGIYRSRIFPGLWLDGPGFLRKDLEAVLKVLESGLATPEHAAFVTSLASPPA